MQDKQEEIRHLCLVETLKSSFRQNGWYLEKQSRLSHKIVSSLSLLDLLLRMLETGLIIIIQDLKITSFFFFFFRERDQPS